MSQKSKSLSLEHGIFNAMRADKYITVILKDYWDEKNLQIIGPSPVNAVHIRVLLFEENKIF